jgi:Fur family ferric uptake transcriptional regulator
MQPSRGTPSPAARPREVRGEAAARPRATRASSTASATASVVRRRDTRARRAIAQATARLARVFTAADLYALVRPEGIGLTTVYRTLSLLVAEGMVAQIGQHDGETLYVPCGVSGHHHHLVCVGCGLVERSDVCRCDELGDELAREHGFVLTTGGRVYYGLCASCAKAR